jgi:outer membrane lipoprotein-sorting protein
MLVLAVLGSATACRKSRKTTVPSAEVRPALEATPDQLLEQYNQQARAVRSLNAGVELNPVAGSTYSGVIEDYTDVRGFILAQKPSHIRVIGQAPVVAKNIFDMVSDGETFRIFIPSKNKFVVGPAEFERPSQKPIENLRPQHLLDALFWPEVRGGSTVLFEEFEAMPERYYILTVVRGSGAPEISRRIWFDRADLSVARMQVYGPRGRLLSDIRYGDWQPLSDVRYPRHVTIRRPRDDYQLEIRITRLTLNEDIAADRFRLEQPAGTELVRVGEPSGEVRP